ncbi:20072_t:CDS:2 [Funneliformis geosporum]|uniref:Peroxiredoxin-like 2A n=1 Tax=Funneliformis geosporum TaxID=1117311 RepID=A0A9W4SKA5_9GLOM|nr:20072_t:CDS:2 [Funneliformis geosporum]CAI2172615.1 13052_t:CDS:2 [Funneliformis geosporum]
MDTKITPIDTLRNITLTELKDNSNFKAGKIWENAPALILVVRRPGCQLCREESVRISSLRELISGKMGLNMVAIVHENLNNEVEDFNQGFWKGTVYFDKEKAFFSAIGGGKIQYAGLTNILKPTVWYNIWSNYKTGVTGNLKGDGTVLGGTYIIKSGTEGGKVIYQYREKVWGDHAPLEEVLKACEQVSPKNGEASIQSDIKAALEKVKSESLLLKEDDATSKTCNSQESCG